MLKDFFKNYVYPTATLAGSIIGVGFLSLPYIALQVGIWLMLAYFVILTALMVLIHVIFGKVSLKTPDHKRFPGFVGYYLGAIPRMITLISTILGSFGLFIIYFIVGSQFIAAMTGSVFSGSTLAFIILYFSIASLFVYFGVNTISKVEFWALLLLVAIFCVVFFTEFSHISAVNIIGATKLIPSDWKVAFLPYGAIIFSLWGVGLIPEIEEMVPDKKRLLIRNIILGVLVPAVIYLLFIFLILGISGAKTTEVAITGLRGVVSSWVFLAALSIGLLTTFIAFITQGLFLKKIFVYDMGVKEFPAWLITCGAPLVLFLLGFKSFIPLVSLMGGVLLGINGIFILLMYKKTGGKKIIVYPLVLFFVLGIVYELIYFVK